MSARGAIGRRKRTAGRRPDESYTLTFHPRELHDLSKVHPEIAAILDAPASP